MKAFLKNLFQYGCYAAFAISIFYLTLLSMFSTSATQLKKVVEEGASERWENYNYFLPDSPWKHLIICGLFLLLLFAARYAGNKRSKKKISIKPQWICLLFFLICVWFICFTKLVPISDPAKILTIARQMKANNFEQFGVGGYMHRYPDQTGIVLIFYCIHSIFGETDYLAIQILNAALLTGSYYLISEIACLLWGEEVRNTALLLCFIFFPAGLYITLIYGTVPGFAFGILAFYLLLKYLHTGRLAYMSGAAASISFAIVWKTNSLIMFIAMCIYLVYDLVIEKGSRRKKSFLALLLLIGMNAVSSFAVSAAAEKITGSEVAEGMPKTAWIAMGLQESGYGPGVWNGYSVGLYEKNDYVYEKTDEAAKQEIVRLLGGFAADKSYGTDFFGRKNAMQWNDPTFHCLELIDGRQLQEDRNMDTFTQGPLKYHIIRAANVLQTAILLGVCFYLLYIFMRKEQKNGELLLGITVVGGMIFHMFWEAKSQYILPYFLMLLPYSAAGYSEAVQRMAVLWDEKERNKEAVKKKCLTAIAGAGILCILLGGISMLSGLPIVSYTVHVQNEPERLEQYEEAVQRSMEEYKKTHNKE